MTKQEKIEFVIEHWQTMSVKELSQKIETAPMTISQWAKRLRSVGVNLPPKMDMDRINWKYLQEKYANK